MEKRIRAKLEEINALYDQHKDGNLSTFGRGCLAGIKQTLLWLLEPEDWLEPLSIVGLQD